MEKAVFFDRDNTLMEDPGYLTDPAAVKLLPGVEPALRSLAQEGYKLVVVTNQSGIARGLLTAEALERIHAELRRQLVAGGAHLDAIYACPFHPEGTVEQYARESDLRKPSPGMLLQAARDLDIDLAASWMVGDSARDIEAGQRAGCRTIRIRSAVAVHHTPLGSESADEAAQADYTVRNLVEASRIILRPAPPGEAPSVPPPPEPPAAAKAPCPAAPPMAPAAPTPAPAAAGDADTDVRREILRHVRQLARADQIEEFSFAKLFGAVVQVLALVALAVLIVHMIRQQLQEAMVWGLLAVTFQLMTLTLYVTRRR